MKVFAPGAKQMHIINHLEASPAEERGVGGKCQQSPWAIQDLADLNFSELNAAIIPAELDGSWVANCSF